MAFAHDDVVDLRVELAALFNVEGRAGVGDQLVEIGVDRAGGVLRRGGVVDAGLGVGQRGDPVGLGVAAPAGQRHVVLAVLEEGGDELDQFERLEAHVDAQHFLDLLDVDVAGVFLDLVDVGREVQTAVGVERVDVDARHGEQLLGAGAAVGDRGVGDLRVAGHLAVGQSAVGPLSAEGLDHQVVVHGLVDRLGVQRVHDRQAQVHVVQRGLGRVEDEDLGDECALHLHDPPVGVVLDLRDELGLGDEHRVEVAGQAGGDQRRVLGDDVVAHLVEVGQRVAALGAQFGAAHPVVVVARAEHVRLVDPLDEAVGPGADGVEAVLVAQLFGGGDVDHRAGAVAEQVHHGRGGLVEVVDRGQLVGRVDAGDDLEVGLGR